MQTPNVAAISDPYAGLAQQVGSFVKDSLSLYQKSKDTEDHVNNIYAGVQKLAQNPQVMGLDDKSAQIAAQMLKPTKDDVNNPDSYERRVTDTLSALHNYTTANAQKETDQKVVDASLNSPNPPNAMGAAPTGTGAQPPQQMGSPKPPALSSFQSPQSVFSSVATGGGPAPQSQQKPVAPPVQNAINKLAAPGSNVTQPDTSKLDPSFASLVGNPSPMAGIPSGGAPAPASLPPPAQGTPALQPAPTAPQNAPQGKSSMEQLIDTMDPIYQPHAKELLNKAMAVKNNPTAAREYLSEITKIATDDQKLKGVMQERNLTNNAEMERTKYTQGEENKRSEKTNTTTLEHARIMAAAGEEKSKKQGQNAYRSAGATAMRLMNANRDFQTQNGKVSQAAHAMSLIEQATDPKTGQINLNQVQSPELAMTMANLVSGSNSHTQEEFRAMSPKALQTTMNDLLSKLGGKPTNHLTQDWAKNFKETIVRQGLRSQQLRDESGYQEGPLESVTAGLDITDEDKQKMLEGMKKVGFDFKGKYATPENVPKVTDQASYAKIPSGGHYYDPQGNLRTKP